MGAILLAHGSGRAVSPFTTRSGLALALGSAAAGAILPWPERLGFLLIAAGSVIAVLPGMGARLGGVLWRGLVGSGALLTLMALASHGYRFLETAVDQLSFVAHPYAFFYRILGFHATADPPVVHLQGVGKLHSIDCSIEKVLGYGLVPYLLATCVLLMAVGGPRFWRRLALLLLSSLVYVAVRIVVLGLLLSERTDISMFWSRGWVFGALLPLTGLLALVLPRWPAASEGRASPTQKPAPGPSKVELLSGTGPAVLATASFLGVFAALAIGFSDPGKPKEGRIIVDECHSNWAWSTIALGKDSYGVQTVYNYSEMIRYLGHFYRIAPNFDTLTDSLLSSTDVLVLKTPTRPYEDREVDAVIRFVERGGGLWLIGDHTNIFGMSTNLNKVSERLGIRYRFDAVIDLQTGGRQLYQRPRLFAHPVVAHLPPLLLATSCSLDGPLLGQHVITGHSLLSDKLDYSVNSFFGDFTQQPDERFGSMLQATSTIHGKGRVLFFTDSTIFSNFFIFIRGKRELALGSVAWLMRENRWTWVRPASLVTAAVALMAFLWLSRRAHRAVPLASLGIAGAPAFALSAMLLATWVGRWAALPEPKIPMAEVAFARDRCAFHIPERMNIPDRSAQSYHTFYIWTQRVGLFPRTDRLKECIRSSEATVILNPRGHFSTSILSDLDRYVRDGGGLLVLDRPFVKHSTANQVLERFQMRFDPAAVESVAVTQVAGGDTLVLRNVSPVEGGEPLLVMLDGRAALSRKRVGRGQVIAICASDNFSDAALGTTSEVPDPLQLKLYQIQFQIFQELSRSLQVPATRDGE